MKNMKKLKMLAVALAGSLAIIGCSDGAQDDVEDVATTLQDTASSLANDFASVSQEVQLAATRVLAEIEASDVTDDVRNAWTEIANQVTNIATDAEVDQAALEAQIEVIQSELDAMGDEASVELTTAWDEFRAAVRRLMEEM